MARASGQRGKQKGRGAKRERRAKPKQKPALPAVMTGSVLALDTSSKTVGWAYFIDGDLVEYGKYRPEGPDHGEKLAGYTHWLIDALIRLTPDHLVVEEPFFHPRQWKAFGVLRMYYGVALACHFQHFGFELPESNSLSPSSVKATLVASHGEKLTYDQRKERMVIYMNEVYNLGLVYQKNSVRSDDDIADAIAVARAWLIKRGSA